MIKKLIYKIGFISYDLWKNKITNIEYYKYKNFILKFYKNNVCLWNRNTDASRVLIFDISIDNSYKIIEILNKKFKKEIRQNKIKEIINEN